MRNGYRNGHPRYAACIVDQLRRHSMSTVVQVEFNGFAGGWIVMLQRRYAKESTPFMDGHVYSTAQAAMISALLELAANKE